MTKRNFQQPPNTWPSFDTGLRKLSQRVASILRGKQNNTFEVTLGASVTTTTLSDSIITPDSEAFITPKTATAATAIGAGVVYVSCTAGVATITHDSSAATDRTFGVVICG